VKSLAELWSLQGKVALITGSGRGLGLAVARRLSEAGACVVINDLDGARARQVADDLKRHGATASAAPGDIASDDEARTVVEHAIGTFGRVDILVNNAGLVPLQAFDQMSRSEWDRLMAVNVRGALTCADLISKRMIERGAGGSIINVLSVGAVRPLQADLIAYCASKAALLMSTEVLALSLAPHRIRVNGLLPTVMRTDSTASIPDLHIPSVPLGRLVEPDEVARGAVFLASDMAEFVTGITLPVDGGRLLN
jgi:NAD(P)-dependent dehydrogenase (short-subunit alcohol dehydrogenase family)